MKRSILIVEDDQAIREALQECLETEGYSVLTAENGRVGIEKISSTMPALVLLDLYMPIMNGLDFLKEGHEMLSKASVPVILCTAAPRHQDDFIQAASFSQAVVKKPIKISELLDAVEKYYVT